MSREAADSFFELFGGRHDVDARLASIEQMAAEAIADIEKTNERKGKEEPYPRGQYARADIKHWAAYNLKLCTTTFHVPLPPSLLRLTVLLLNVPARKRSAIQNPKKFREAAIYKAEHPDATPSAVCKAIEYYQKVNVVKRWFNLPEFKEEVYGITRLERTSSRRD